ncbi:hypothetical protein ACFQJC_07335 [Haloferax namakaokahaiae]|uniref:DNA recombination and repair protein Rad51-like C-terminal domain-containing protein n=1 Tax=Haloferax namakaokahaiae TaxID=1748331 RepID=A0ABD5ZDZ8_9EURY
MMGNRNRPELPSLGSGITLLEQSTRTMGALHSLVLDQVLLGAGRALWIDTHGNGCTEPLVELVPSMRVLDRIRIARSFTPWQHCSLLRDLGEAITPEIGLVVVPEFDRPYRDDDLARGEAERLFEHGVELVARVAEAFDISVLCSRSQRDSLSAPLESVADETLACESTQFGPRFTGDEFETLVYPLGDGWIQTTLAFWKRVLLERHPSLAEAPVSPEVSVGGSY